MEKRKAAEIKGKKTWFNKVGLYFGSFNPIHIGHLAIANFMLEFTALEEIWFIVSPQNPLKKRDNLLADHHRLMMVSLAVEEFPRFRASNIEFSLPQPSYTINTLVVLNEKYPEKEFSLIMGTDNLESINKWRSYETILKDYKIYTYPRPGYSGESFSEYSSVIRVDAPLMEISSSFIRKALAEKKNIRFFLPEKVYNYIEEMNFYR